MTELQIKLLKSFARSFFSVRAIYLVEIQFKDSLTILTINFVSVCLLLCVCVCVCVCPGNTSKEKLHFLATTTLSNLR